MQNILIVEDDPILATALSSHLKKNGYHTIVESAGDRAVGRILAERPDAVILDGNLPGMDGFSVCREVRPSYLGPIVMLTGRDEDIDRILGLELGADDYLVKPVEPRVVEAHLKACLRRASAPAAEGANELRFGKLRINRVERVVRLGDKDIPLTTAEFELLWTLAESAGSIVSRDQLMKGLRSISHDGLDRSIDMRVSRLRARLSADDKDMSQRIKTVRAKGYLFSPSGWE